MTEFKKYVGSEKNFQIQFARYLDHLGLCWGHYPAGGTRIKLEAASLKKQGTKSGVPDCCIFEPNKDYHGLFIELKVKYNKPSPAQNAWITKLNQRGYLAVVSYSLDECIDIVRKYLKNV